MGDSPAAPPADRTPIETYVTYQQLIVVVDKILTFRQLSQRASQ